MINSISGSAATTSVYNPTQEHRAQAEKTQKQEQDTVHLSDAAKKAAGDPDHDGDRH